MKLNKILKEGARTQYSKEVYKSIIDALNCENLTIELRLDGEHHGVCVFGLGGWVDISDDEIGVRLEWHMPLATSEVTHIKEEVLEI